MFAGNGIQTGTGLIENQEFGPSHECAADEDALPFALGKEQPWLVREGRAFDFF